MILGYFQVAGMLELALNMLYLNNPEKADQAVKLTFRVILVVNLTILAVMSYLSVKFILVLKGLYMNCTLLPGN